MTDEVYPSTRPSVLIVDDDPDICHALSDLLEHAGYDVRTAGTGAQAKRATAHQRFSAVILDVGLPDIDGATLLRELTAADPSLPVIMLTAFTGEEHAVGLLRQGAYAFLGKPYNREQLKATLARAVGVQALATRAERMARALNESEQRFQSVMESVTDAIIFADPGGEITSWNAAARALFGYAEVEILGRPFATLFPSRDREQYRLDMLSGEMDRGLLGRTVELHGLRTDGREFPAELCLELVKGDHRVFYSAFIRDLTERKETQARLEEGEARLRLALMAANMGTWDWDITTDRVTWSEQVPTLLGISMRDFEGGRAGFLALVHPDDRARVQEAIRRTVEDGADYDVDHRIRRPDGEIRWLQCKGRGLCDAQGRMVRLLGTVQDITERKQVQEQLLRQQIEQQVLLDLIPAMVWYKDEHNCIVRANRLAAASINRTPEEIQGHSTYEFYPDEAEQYHQDDLAVIRSGQPKLGIVELYQLGSGEKRWVQTDKVPYRSPQGDIRGVLVFAQDITERRQAEEALQSSEARFRAFMDLSPVLAFMKDDGGRYCYANRSWEACMKQSRDQWYGKTDDDLFPPAVAAACRDGDRRVLEGDGPVESFETTIDEDGTQRGWLIVKFLFRHSTGERFIGGIAQELPVK